MLHHWWRRRRRGNNLSAYVDGELDWEVSDRVAEELVFDAAAQRELSRMRAVDALVDRVLTPPTPAADGDAVADWVVSQVGTTPPVASSTPRMRSRWRPAVVASVGILVTAGVAFAGLKRRGLV
jgi:anti-sigma factor RsiW